MSARVLVLVLLLAGCNGPRPRPFYDKRPEQGPGELEIESAASDLDTQLDELGGWPKHLPRSKDFPDLPLCRIGEIEDLGRTGIDAEALGRTLERAVRDHRRVRLVADENAVPEVLRDDAPARDPEDDPLSPRPEPRVPAKAGLLLRAWTDRAGRLQLELRDLVLDERIVRARSR